MITQIEVTLREVYGVTKAYPAGDQAKLLAKMLGTTTLTVAALTVAKAMGFELVYVDRFGRRESGVETTKMLLSVAA